MTSKWTVCLGQYPTWGHASEGR